MSLSRPIFGCTEEMLNGMLSYERSLQYEAERYYFKPSHRLLCLDQGSSLRNKSWSRMKRRIHFRTTCTSAVRDIDRDHRSRMCPKRGCVPHLFAEMQYDERSFNQCRTKFQSDDTPYSDSAEAQMDKVFKFAMHHLNGKINKEYLMKLLEDVIILYHLLLENGCMTFSKVYNAFYIFMKLRTDGPITPQIIRVCEKFLLKLFGLPDIQSDDVPIDPEGIRARSKLFSVDKLEEFVDMSRAKLTSYEELKKCAAFQKIYKLCMFALANSLFSKIGITMDLMRYTKVEQAAVRSQYWMGPDFFMCMADTGLFLCQRGIQCYKSGSIDPIFHSSNKYLKFFEDCMKMKKWSKQLANCEEFGFSTSQYLCELDDNIAKAKAIYRHASIVGAFEAKMSLQMQHDLEMLKFEFTMQKHARKMRKAPFTILLYGDTSIGKSTMMQILFAQYGKVRGLPTSSEYMYVKNPQSEFYDGFNKSQWCLFIDDAASLKPSKCPTVDPTLSDIILAVNSIPWCPNQASLEEKGKNPFMGELVVSSTNTQDLNAFHYFACPSAVQRRFPFIVDMFVRPEFLSPEGTLDSSKVPAVTDGGYPELWAFTVKKIKPVSVRNVHRGNADTKDILKGVGMKEFLKWYVEAIKIHNRDQTAVKDSMERIAKLSVCKQCHMPPKYCDCIEVPDFSFPSLSRVETESHGSFVPDPIYVNVEHDANMNLVEAEFQTEDMALKFVMFCAICTWLAKQWFALYSVFYLWSYISSFWTKTKECKTHIVTKIKEKRASITALREEVSEAYMKPEYWKVLGTRVQKSIGYPQVLGLVATLFVAFIVLRKTMNMMKGDTDLQGLTVSKENFPKELQEIGKTPVVIDPEPENVWKKEEFVLSKFDVSPQNIGAKQSVEQFNKMVLNNCVVFTYYYTENGVEHKRSQRAFCFMGRQYIVNTHFLEKAQGLFKLHITQMVGSVGVNTNVTVMVNRQQCVAIPDTDISIITLSDMPLKKNLLNYFVKSTFLGRHNGYYISRNLDGSEKIVPVIASKTQIFSHPHLAKPVEAFVGHVDVPTVHGDCGTVLVLDTYMGPIICGIHIAGRKNGEVITHRVTVEELKKYSKCDFQLQAGAPMLSAPDFPVVVTDLRPQAHVRYIPDGTGEVYGSIPNSRNKNSSSVGISPIAELLKPFQYGVRYGPPVMQGWRPWDKGIRPLAEPNFGFDDAILDKVEEAILHNFFKGLPEGWEKDVMVYDIYTAINGVAGLKFVDSVNRNTSMGFPWCKSKKFFMQNMPPKDGLTDPKMFTPEILERVNKIILNYCNGDLNHPIFLAHLKDEARSLRKIMEAATRVFTGSPIDFSLVMRMYYLSLVRLIQKNKFTFMSAPGCNATSWEWHDAYNYLTKFGLDRMVAGDYRNFDKQMPAKIILRAFALLIEIAKRAGFSEVEILVMYGVAEDTAHALLLYNGDLVKFFRGNPSGHPLTVIINCLANIIYMFYCYYNLNPEKECMSFCDFVALLTYGDDNIMGVSKKIPWFNHTAIVAELAKVNIVYTMADKDAPSVPYIHIDQCTFLKRNWRMHPVGYMVGQLDHDSIEKMLMVWVYSKSVPVEEQGVAILNAALREYFWYGEEKFKEKRLLFEWIVEQKNWKMWMDRPFPLWEDLMLSYYQASSEINTQTYGVLPDFTLQIEQTKARGGGSSHCSPETPSHCDLDERMDFDCLHTRAFPEDCIYNSVSMRTEEIVKGSERGVNPDPSISLTKQNIMNYNENDTFQSDDVTSEPTGAVNSGSVKEQILVEYIDENPGLVEETAPVERSYFSSYMDTTQLSNFLSRPLRIQAYTWSEGSGITQTFQPWDNFFHSTNVLYKLNNYAFINCKLHLKVLINASPFYYGAAMLTYCPNTTLTPDNMNSNVTNGSNSQLSPLSTRPKVMLYPQTNQGGELVLPFFYHRNWLSVKTRADFQGMGTCTLQSFTSLQDASASAGSGVTITVYAWATDVKLTGSTTAIALQCCDEVIRGDIELIRLEEDMNLLDFSDASSESSYDEDDMSVGNLLYALNNVPCPYAVQSLTPDIKYLIDSLTGQMIYDSYMLMPVRSKQSMLVKIRDLLRNQHSAHMMSMIPEMFCRLLPANQKELIAYTMMCLTDALNSEWEIQVLDEYSDRGGVISGPASAVANVASKLKTVPVIGVYARATEMVASAVGSVARLFGFTNTPVISDAEPYRPTAFHGFASTQIAQPTEKLTFDPKNELSIDPRLAGIGSDDEMNISNIVEREAYFTQFNWATSNSTDDCLETIFVNPYIVNTWTYTNGTATQTNMQGTPISHVGAMFANWRGNIIFRFRFVCSRFHRGRAIVQWDPVADVSTVANVSNVVFTKIVDISEETDVEIVVPYLQAREWLDTPIYTNASNKTAIYYGSGTSSAVSGSYDVRSMNGYLTVKCLTVLTAPVSTSTIQVLCSVRADTNFEYANPNQIPTGLSVYSLQCLDVELQASDLVSYDEPMRTVLGDSAPQDPQSHVIYMGETMVSLRQYMRRTFYLWSRSNGPDTTDLFQYLASRHSYFPLYYGFDPNGKDTANSIAATSTKPFNNVQVNPITWMGFCYKAYRGSMIYHYNLDSSIPIAHVKAFRYMTGIGSSSGYNYNSNFTSGSGNAAQAYFISLLNPGISGMSLTNQQTQAGVSVLYPMYSGLRLRSVDPAGITLGNGADDTNLECACIETLLKPTTQTTGINSLVMHFYVSVGTDFSMLFFLNVPPMVVYPSITFP